ncbi:MAG TPA: aminopeptidase [Roseateles sp.]|nr:aminopeptidase [Roseateles sp.]
MRILGRRWACGVLLLSAAWLSGCAQVGYLGQAASGHLRLVAAAKPVPELVNDPGLDARLRERLLLSQRLRDFASARLGLPDNASYRRYADLQRPAAVWNVVATPELSLTLRTWCYPVMGCAGYRGFFDRAEAEAYAAGLRAEGLEVLVYGVPAYSTLGWSWLFGGDPLLNTFIRYPEGELARLIFHELAHQVAYAADDTEFNESFATAVERLGVEAWLAANADAAAREQYRQGNERRERFRALTQAYRGRLKTLYEGPQDEAAKRVAKAALFAQLRAEPGLAGYEGWLASANNASLAIQAAYNGLAPDFEALFERRGRDWAAFYAEVRRLAALPKPERRRQLEVQCRVDCS